MSNSLQATPLHEVGADQPAGSLNEFLRQIGILSWTVLAFTDGSGSTRDKPGGYAGVYCYGNGEFRILTGQISSSTSQEAELRAVFEVINAVLADHQNLLNTGALIQLISDNKYVVDRLSKLDPLSPLDSTKHTMFIGGILEAARQGIKVIPYHVPRNQIPLMELADQLSKVSRRSNIVNTASEMLANILGVCSKEFSLELPKPRRLRK